MADPYEHIRFEHPADRIVRLVLNRPAVANAMNVEMFEELDDALTAIERDAEVHAWVLTGAPRLDGRPWFSAGADLKSPGASPTRVEPARVVDRIDSMLKPSVAAIGGVCTTGALELVLACDIRVAGWSARLSDWHLKVTGLGIGRWGSAVRLCRLVGTDRAKELLLTGRELSGKEAGEVGLVHRAVSDDQLDATALDIASAIASAPPAGVRATLGFLALQESQSKHEALRWADLTPSFMGLEMRPFRDAAARFDARSRHGRDAPGSV